MKSLVYALACCFLAAGTAFAADQPMTAVEKCQKNDAAACVQAGDQCKADKAIHEAANYYGKACMLNDGAACLAVAKLYYEGPVLPPDYRACMNYSDKGCALGNTDACLFKSLCPNLQGGGGANADTTIPEQKP